MPPDRVRRELLVLAERLGIVVRYEAFDPGLVRMGVIPGRGGLCKVHGKPTVLLDARLPLLDQVAVLADALGRFDVEAIYVPPFLRARLAAGGRS